MHLCAVFEHQLVYIGMVLDDQSTDWLACSHLHVNPRGTWIWHSVLIWGSPLSPSQSPDLFMGMLHNRVIHSSPFAEEERCNDWSPLHSPLLVTTYSNMFNNSLKQAQWLRWGLLMSMASGHTWSPSPTFWKPFMDNYERMASQLRGTRSMKVYVASKTGTTAMGMFHDAWSECMLHLFLSPSEAF